jgi:addiction module HigA family antidote
MPPIIHPGEILKDELKSRQLSANRLALEIGVPPGRIIDIQNGRRSISADTALRLGRYFGTGAKLWINLQSSYDLALAERDHGAEIARTVRSVDAA